jgi:hypothetical protein
MRSLGIARYRFLTTVRRLRWVGPLLFMALIMPMIATADAYTRSDADFAALAPDIYRIATGAMMAAWLLNVGTIMMLGWSFGARHREKERTDLLDTAPISAMTHFQGDTLGFFAAMFLMHICCLPMLAEIVAISPLPASVVWWLELVSILLFFIAAAGAAWSLRVNLTGWRQLLIVRQMAVFAISIVMILAVTTRVDDFYQSVGTFFLSPSTVSWAAIVAAIDSVSILILLMLLLIGTFIAYFAFDAARTIERA